MFKTMAKKEEEVKEIKFTQQEVDNLAQVFTLARLQTVTANPNEKKPLVDLLNFETQFINKLNVDSSESSRE